MNKKIVLGLASTFTCGMAFAAAPMLMPEPAPVDNTGVYVGIQLGYADLHYDRSWLKKELSPDFMVESVKTINDTGFAGRLELGYRFNNYIAAEIGAAYLPETEFKGVHLEEIPDSAKATFNTYLFDLFLKGIVPIQNSGFSVYAKGGVASIHRDDIKVKMAGVTSKGSDDTKTVGAAGIGAAYNFTQQFSADVSWVRYFSNGNLEDIDFASLGLIYQFS